MLGFLKNIFSRSSEPVLGIDIGSSSIKVVQIKKKNGKAVLDTYGSLALGPYGGKEIGQAVKLSNNKIVEALSDIIRESGVSTQNCGLAIPFESSLTSVVKMPTNDIKALDKMVPIEARKYIPVSISEVTLDWMVVPKEESSQSAERGGKKNESGTEVLMVAIHNETLNNFQDIVQKAQLNAGFFELEIFSTTRTILDENPKPVVVFDFGAASTKLYLVERGVIRASHTVNKGSQDVTKAIGSNFGITTTEAEQMKRGHGLSSKDADVKMADVVSVSLNLIFSDTNRFITNFQKKYNKKVEKIYLVGGGSTLKGFKELAQEGLSTEVIAGDAFGKIETPAFLEQALKETGPEFTSAVGVALRRLQEVS